MHPSEINDVLNTLTILADTREHPGKLFDRRMECAGIPYRRYKLDFGDYSGAISINGQEHVLSDIVSIERKMDCNELAMCFGKERGRFEREFERATAAGSKIYLLIENENWEKVYNGKYGDSEKYRSRFNPKALKGSLIAWSVRFGIHIMFCKEETTGKLIKDILYYETREALENGNIC